MGRLPCVPRHPSSWRRQRLLSMEELFCLTKVGMEVMVNAAGQCDGSLQREEVHPFLAWLALAFRSSLSLRL